MYRAFLSILSIIAGFVFAFVSSQLFSYDTLNERQTWAINFLVPSLGFFLLVIVLYQTANKEMLKKKTDILKLYGEWSLRAIKLGFYLTGVAILCLCIAVGIMLYFHRLIPTLIIWSILVSPMTLLGFYMSVRFTSKKE